MRLTELKNAVAKLVGKERKGKKIKSKKITRVLHGLKAKEKRLVKTFNKENSEKTKKRLKLKIKVVRAQINKAQRLLKKLAD